MNRYLLPYCLFFTLILSGCTNAPNPNPEVRHFGALKNMMHQGDLTAKIALSDLDSAQHLYALGAVEDLKGEILIWDNVPYISQKKSDRLLISENMEFNAALLVCADVENWTPLSIPQEVRSEADFDAFLSKKAKENGLSTDAPFPFLVKGSIQEAKWHVIDWPEGDLEHSHEKHIRSGLFGKLENEEVEILGFYSEDHKGVFTHHTSNMHLHLRSVNGELAGHLDEFELGAEMELYLPEVR